MTNTNQTNIELALAYYKAMADKDVAELAKYVDPNVHFIGPLAEMHGKAAVVEAASKFMHFFTKLTMRAEFSADDQVVLIFDLECPEPIGILRSAAFMTFKNGLMVRTELFYDASKFQQHKGKIFDK